MVFKLNGRTLRKDYRFDTDKADPLKINVVKGKATITIIADQYLRKGQNISASFSGTHKYDSSNSPVVKASIKLRSVKLNVTANITTAKQDTKIKFIVNIRDVTKNAKNKTALKDGYLTFKVNGVSVKYRNGSLIKVPVKSNTVKYTWKVPRGFSGIDSQKHIKNYTITASYTNKEYTNKNKKNTTVLHVLRSKTTIKFTKTLIKNNKMSIKANILDYENKNVVGTNKVCVKINGYTYKENGKTKYFIVKNGKVNIKGIKITNPSKVKSVSLVTGERQAYLKASATTKKIIKQQ